MHSTSRFFRLVMMLLITSGLVFSQQKHPTAKPVKIKIEGKIQDVYRQSYALLIGEGKYNTEWKTLDSVRQQTLELESLLKEMGFITTVLLDADKAVIDKAVSTFINNYGLKTDNRLLFYFAGHGHSMKSSVGITIGNFIPIDAPKPEKDITKFREKALETSMIELYARQIKCRHALFIFDACFSGTFMSSFTPDPQNISEESIKPVREIIIAGSKDETESSPSLFTGSLISGLKGAADLNNDEYITGSELAKYISSTLRSDTGYKLHTQFGKTRGREYMKGDFIFEKPKIADQEPPK